MKKYFIYTGEYVSGRSFFYRFIFQQLLTFFGIGLYFQIVTFYSRSRSLGISILLSFILSLYSTISFTLTVTIIFFTLIPMIEMVNIDGIYFPIINLPFLYLLFKNGKESIENVTEIIKESDEKKKRSTENIDKKTSPIKKEIESRNLDEIINDLDKLSTMAAGNYKVDKKVKKLQKGKSANKITSTTKQKTVSIKNTIKKDLLVELDNQYKDLNRSLVSTENKSSMYSGGILKTQIKSNISAIKLNMFYNQSVELLHRIEIEKEFSKTELAKVNNLIAKNVNFINSELNSNKNYKGALIEVNNHQLNLCLSILDLNKVLLSILSKTKISLSLNKLKSKISSSKALSAKYKPCLVKSNIDMGVVINSIIMLTIEYFNGSEKNLNQIKKEIKDDTREISKYKPSIYPILLSTKRKINQLIFIKESAKIDGLLNLTEIQKIKKENLSDIKYLDSEIKKYAPSTRLYVVMLQKGYCNLLK